MALTPSAAAQSFLMNKYTVDGPPPGLWPPTLMAQRAVLELKRPVFVTRIVPTGNYRDDVEAIKNAVDDPTPPPWQKSPASKQFAGQRQFPRLVVLGATGANGQPQFFNLGDDRLNEPRATIQVGASVSITGEKLQGYPTFAAAVKHQPPIVPITKTVIYGGRKVFRCADPDVELSIASLYFAYPEWSAVMVTESAGVTITDCVVYGVTLGLSSPGGQDIRGAFGFEVTSKATTRPDYLTGTLAVHRNTLYRDPADVDMLFDAKATFTGTPADAPDDAGCGIAVQRTQMAIDIQDNTIQNFSWAGIGVMGNKATPAYGDGALTISGNEVTACGWRHNITQKALGKTSGGILLVGVDATKNGALVGRKANGNPAKSNTIVCVSPATAAPHLPGCGIALVDCVNVEVLHNILAGDLSQKDGIIPPDPVIQAANDLSGLQPAP